MIDFWEVLKRSENGVLTDEKKFDIHVGRTANKVIKKYNIKFDPEEVCPSDDDLADRLFEAAVEFFLEVGVYCTDTNRVMKFTRDELFESIQAGVNECVFGENKDMRILTHRKVEDSKTPFCNFSLVGTPYPEDQFLQAAMSLAKERLSDTFSSGSLLNTLGGVEVRSGSPMEVEAAIWDVGKRREAACRSGCPGKGLYTQVSSAERADAMIAAARREFGALDRDGVLLGAIAEMKVDYDRMKKVPFLNRTSYPIGGLLGPLMGGYAGGPEGTAMVLVAHTFLSRLVFNSEYTVHFPIDMRETCNTSRNMLWLCSVVHQALSRNSKLLHFLSIFPTAGPCTEMVCRELIACAIACTVSGTNLAPAATTRNKYPERATGMEGRIAAEAGHAAALSGLTRKQANEICKKLLAKYEADIPTAPLGKKFCECYDLERVEPTAEYVDLYAKIKAEVQEMGLDYSTLY